MKPFLFLGTRAEDDVAADEYAAILRCAALDERDVRRVRLERDPLGEVDLGDWSGIILGGGPFNSSDPEDIKSPAQKRAEAELRELAERVVDADFPFLGACYGIGVLGGLRGGVVDRTYGEPIGAVEIKLTEAGEEDRIFGVLPRRFDAFLGHKEAVSSLPAGATRLAGSATCPVQAFRLGRNVYATQFHPELDVDSLCLRIDVYRHHGYFDPPELAEEIQAMARTKHVEHPQRVIEEFVRHYSN